MILRRHEMLPRCQRVSDGDFYCDDDDYDESSC